MDETGGDVTERRGEAFEFDEQLTVLGRRLADGDAAPPFRLACLDPETDEMQEVGLGDSAGAVRLLNVVNSLDTPDYGVLLEEWRLLQRAVFVIDRDGTVVHAEYVADQMTEPDYDAAVRAAAAAGAR